MDELDAILAIYPEAVVQENTVTFKYEKYQIVIESSPEYPETRPHVYFNLGELQHLESVLLDACQHIPGQYVLFDWISQFIQIVQDAETDQVPVTEQVMEEEFVYQAECPLITSSEPLTVKKSIFVSHVATVKSLDEAMLVRKVLLTNKKIARATHNIVAYRIGTLQDYDDDGETAAGARLLEMMRISNVENVIVIVSRWYGGVQLGPLRFKVINNVARDLLVQQGFISK